ncbi:MULTISPECIES: hypothetical protein [unclassified Serinicoccus]|uniref:hypothetical protein n=1 Tax=unclassified Serinicoccus TaxID=2643101 RepID=UPI003852AEE4
MPDPRAATGPARERRASSCTRVREACVPSAERLAPRPTSGYAHASWAAVAIGWCGGEP